MSIQLDTVEGNQQTGFSMTTATDIAAAAQRISPHLRRTPLERASFLEKGTGEVYLKLENFQVTGSFKVRGALSKLLTLTKEQQSKGVITASSGNHGAAVAYGGQKLGIPVEVYVPTHADPGKIALIESYGAKVFRHGDDCTDAEYKARETANANGLPYISPYNDPAVIAGQGSIGVEIWQDLPDVDAVFIALGGGGLVAGIGTYLKSQRSDIQIIGCSPDQSPALHECMKAGKAIEVPCYPTLSDATAGGVESGAITVELCNQVVDQSLLLTEAEIRQSMLDVIRHKRMLIEGAAGVAVAGFLQYQKQNPDHKVAIVICGANIGFEKLRKVLR